MTSRRRIATLLAAVAMTAPGWGTLAPPAAAQDTSAVAINTHDDSSVFRLAFSVHRVLGDVVDEQNAAVAYASCEACQTVAISIQVLIVVSDPSVVDPFNLALAINQNCSLCATLASAYQFVLGGGNLRLQLSGQGRQELQRIHQELLRLRKSGLSIEEIQAQTDGLMDRLRQVLATQLVVLGPRSGAGGGSQQTAEQALGASATPTQPQQSPSQTTPSATTPSEATPTETQPPQGESTQPTSGSGSDQTTSQSGSDQTESDGGSTP